MKTITVIRVAGLLVYMNTLSPAADKIWLRDGSTLTASVQSVQTDAYFANVDGAMRRLPRSEMAFVVYENVERAERFLKISQARRLAAKPDLAEVNVLSAQAFGEAITELAGAARRRICVAQFLISGAQSDPIRSFYETLKQKSLSGVEVEVVVEFGSGTGALVKLASREFGDELEAAGVRMFYHCRPTVLHKKLLIVDDEAVILGSSNLTLAGTWENNEMNVLIRDPAFVQTVLKDFEEVKNNALDRSQLNDRLAR
ncbi:MAG: phospholipase D family protein [Verrucomicrobia bacterium]|nr:phospholipase D family protein [Verrucomicrobiota bacterium]